MTLVTLNFAHILFHPKDIIRKVVIHVEEIAVIEGVGASTRVKLMNGQVWLCGKVEFNHHANA